MTSSRFSFLRRVRIHGGECGAVARALHHAAQREALMTHESLFLSQADLGNVSESTSNERKQMSTKTSIKRIALVAVSALGFGLMSTLPANAAAAAATPFGVTAALTAPDDSFAATVAVTQVAGALNFVEFTAGADTAAGSLPVVKVTGGTIIQRTNSTGSTGTINTAGTELTWSTVDLEGDADASFRVGTPTEGTITVVVANRAATSGIVADTTLQTFTITVRATPVVSAAYSTVHIADGANAGTSATNLIGAYHPAALTSGAATQAANITVTLRDQTNTAISARSVSATISGPGTLGITAVNDTYNAASSGRAVTLASAVDNIANISVWNDGTSGVGTITISSGTTVLATRTVTFYGTVTKITATQNLKVARASSTGEELGCNDADCELDGTAAETPAVSIVATDANGNVVPGLVITGVSSNPLILASASVTEDNGTNGDGPGNYNASVTSAPLAASGSTATITFRTVVSSTVTLTAEVTFTLGGSVYNSTVSLDKASYTPGEPMVVTRTATDSAGNPVFDGAPAGTVTFSKLVGGAATIAATEYRSGQRSTSATAPVVYAPSFEGAFTALFAGVTAGVAATKTTTATVSNSAASIAAEAATDAALEAIDAANAATDAANLAAEAADAATVAAEEARDAADAATAAVEALASEVATLIAGLKAQITTLANTVAKIAKRVRA